MEHTSPRKPCHELEEFFRSMENNIMKTMQDMELDGKVTPPVAKLSSPEVFLSPVFNYDRVVSLLLDAESFSQTKTSTVPSADSGPAPERKSRRLRNRTASLPSLHCASNLQKSYCSARRTGYEPEVLAEKEKGELRRNVWQERVLFDQHFPVKCFDSNMQQTSSMLKRPRGLSVSATCRPFSGDCTAPTSNSDLMGGASSRARTLVSCVSAVLCSYLIDVADVSYDPNERDLAAKSRGGSPTTYARSPSPCPSPLSKRSTSPASPSIFNSADPRNYPPLFAFVPRSFQNYMFNLPVRQGFQFLSSNPKANAGQESAINKYSNIKKVTVDMLQDFIEYIYTQSQMEKECLLIALLYMERILFYEEPSPCFNTFYLTSLNWRAFISSALLVSSKMWDDFSMVNGDYVSILRNHHSKTEAETIGSSVISTRRPFAAPNVIHVVDINIHRVNALESKFLALLRFNTCVTGEDYARVYFRITEIMTLINIRQAQRKESQPSSLPQHSMKIRASRSGGDDVEACAQESPLKKFKRENGEVYNNSSSDIASGEISSSRKEFSSTSPHKGFSSGSNYDSYPSNSPVVTVKSGSVRNNVDCDVVETDTDNTAAAEGFCCSNTGQSLHRFPFPSSRYPLLSSAFLPAPRLSVPLTATVRNVTIGNKNKEFRQSKLFDR